jgi:hypothetical protein
MLVFVCYLFACVLLPCDCGCWLVYIAWGAPDYTKRVRPDRYAFEPAPCLLSLLLSLEFWLGLRFASLSVDPAFLPLML